MTGLKLVPALSLYFTYVWFVQFRIRTRVCVCARYLKLLKEISNKKHNVRHKDCLHCHILMELTEADGLHIAS